MKNQYLKYYWTNYKNLISQLLSYDTEFIEATLTFLNKTWPVRYPEKIGYYIDLAENVIYTNKNL